MKEKAIFKEAMRAMTLSNLKALKVFLKKDVFLYLIRHGQVNFPQLSFPGNTFHYDPEISQKGYQQAQEAARNLKEKTDIDILLTSPRRRVQETTNVFAAELNLPYRIIQNLNDCAFYARWSAEKSKEILLSENPEKKFKKYFSEDQPFVFTYYITILSALTKDVFSLYNQGKIAIITHGETIEVIKHLFSKKLLNGFLEDGFLDSKPLPHCSVTKITLKKDHNPIIKALY